MNTPKLDLGSPILKKMPDPSIDLGERLMRVAPCLAAAAVVSILEIGLMLSIYLQMWDEDGPGRILYVLHDRVLLLLKGNIYIRYFPYSLALWGSGLLLTALIIFAWLFRFPLSRWFYILLIYIAIARRRFTGIYLVLLGIHPDLVCAVVRNEFEKALIALGQQQLGKSPKAFCQRVYSLACFTLELQKHFRNGPISFPRAVELWYHSYLMLYAYGDRDNEWFQEYLRGMHTTFDELARTDTAKDEFSHLEHFYLDQLLGEMGEIIAGVESRNEHVSRITDAVDTRRENLDQIYAQLQNELSARAPLKIRRLDKDNLSHDLIEEIASTGRIAQDIALHLALIRSSPAIAQAYLDACDSVQLLTEAFRADSDVSTYRDPVYQFYAHLSGNASSPVTDPYPLLHATNVLRIVVCLAGKDLSHTKDTWQFEFDQDTNFLQVGDFHFEQQQINALAQLDETALAPPIEPVPTERNTSFWQRISQWIFEIAKSRESRA